MTIPDPASTAGAPGVSAPGHDVTIEREVPVPMRDATIRRAEIYRPAPSGRFLVLVERVAYDLGPLLRTYGPYYAERGYVVVGQNAEARMPQRVSWSPFATTVGASTRTATTPSNGRRRSRGRLATSACWMVRTQA